MIFLFLITWLVGAFIVLGFFGRFWWPLDFFANFHLQYFIFFVLAILFFLIVKRPQFAFFSFLVSLALAFSIFWVYTPYDQAPTAQGNNVTHVMSFNILSTRIDQEKLIAYIHQEKPDIVFLIETSPEIFANLSKRLDDYPVREHIPAVSGAKAIYNNKPDLTVFSKLPLEKKETWFPDERLPAIRAQLQQNKRSLVFYGIHPYPPMTKMLYGLREQYLDDIARRTVQEQGPTIVAGDINLTPWSQTFSHFMVAANLLDSRRGFGIAPSWPTWLPSFARISIDHVYMNRQVKIIDRKLGPNLGSDHLPIMTTIQW